MLLTSSCAGTRFFKTVIFPLEGWIKIYTYCLSILSLVWLLSSPLITLKCTHLFFFAFTDLIPSIDSNHFLSGIVYSVQWHHLHSGYKKPKSTGIKEGTTLFNLSSQGTGFKNFGHPHLQVPQKLQDLIDKQSLKSQECSKTKSTHQILSE